MHDDIDPNHTTSPPTVKKTIGRLQLNTMGVGWDWLYRRYLENGRTCPNCGSTHMTLRQMYYNRSRGWRFRCEDCDQQWATPRIQGLLDTLTK